MKILVGGPFISLVKEKVKGGFVDIMVAARGINFHV
jgi:hypothetical protein